MISSGITTSIYRLAPQSPCKARKIAGRHQRLQFPAGSALAYYRERWRDLIDEARASRTERALNEGLALRAERVAKLKEHAEALDALRLVPDKNCRLWNEKAYRQTLADIVEEMGERRPKEQEQSGEVVKVVIGIDPDRV